MTLTLSPTSSEWQFFILIFLMLGTVVGLSEALRKRFNGSPEVTRKLAHILTGILIYFAPQIFTSGIPAILLGVIFSVVNFIAVEMGLLKGLHGTNRHSFGTVYYPLSFLILVVTCWDSYPWILSTSMLVMALADAAAAVVGENLAGPTVYYITSDKKSIEGSITMAAVTFIIVAGTLFLGAGAGLAERNSILHTAAISAVFVTAWEAASSKGFDNLTVPLSTALVLYAMIVPSPMFDPSQLLTGTILALAIAIASYAARFLSLSGSVAAFLLAAIIYGLGGWEWTFPIFVFFIASSILSKAGKKKKKQFTLMFEKSDTRDAGQVAANGGTAGILLLAFYFLTDYHGWYLVYLSSVAAVTADTWGTELGVLFKGSPRSIVSFKKVETGTSGAISPAGMAGAAAGASLISLSALLISSQALPLLQYVFIVIAGLFGSLVDSFLGATIQAQYRCMHCGKITERTIHCGAETVLVRGHRRINNDLVNWSCAVAGAIGGALFNCL